MACRSVSSLKAMALPLLLAQTFDQIEDVPEPFPGVGPTKTNGLLQATLELQSLFDPLPKSGKSKIVKIGIGVAKERAGPRAWLRTFHRTQRRARSGRRAGVGCGMDHRTPNRRLDFSFSSAGELPSESDEGPWAEDGLSPLLCFAVRAVVISQFKLPWCKTGPPNHQEGHAAGDQPLRM